MNSDRFTTRRAATTRTAGRTAPPLRVRTIQRLASVGTCAFAILLATTTAQADDRAAVSVPAATLPTIPAETRPTTGPSTNPATRAAAPVVPAAELVRRLAEADWRQREQVVADLVRTGDEARPLLEELVRTTTALDVRNAAQEALAQIAANRATGPSFVTMHLDGATPQEAFAQLGRQAGVDLKPYPDNLWTHGQLPRVTVHADRQPFWVVMRDLSGQAGLELREINDSLRVMQGGGQTNGRAVVQGAFLIVASQITRTQTIDLSVEKPATDEHFAVQLTAFAEPKLTVLHSAAALKLEWDPLESTCRHASLSIL